MAFSHRRITRQMEGLQTSLLESLKAARIDHSAESKPCRPRPLIKLLDLALGAFAFFAP